MGWLSSFLPSPSDYDPVVSTFSTSVILEGHSRPSPSSVRLFAGPLTMLLEPGSGFVRQIRLGPTILLNGIYAAVRDQNWDTVLPEIRDLTINQEPGSFTVRFKASCINDDVQFIWNGVITGDSGGRIVYTFDGEAINDLLKHRIGFCVLHDANAAGHACSVEHIDGTLTESRFPVHISPQQPFQSIRSITHELKDGFIARVRFEGDVFEMEDQRNWTDASYKTYCTPLDQPFPVELQPGDKVEQKVTFEISDFDAPASDQDTGDAVCLEFVGDSVRTLPRIGFGMASHEIPISELGIDRVKMLKPDHLRVDLRLFTSDWADKLKEASALAQHLNTALHLALFINEDGEQQLRQFAKTADLKRADVILIFHQNEKSTKAKWTKLARQFLSDSCAKIFTGSDAYFTEINRERPEPSGADGVSWSINPQVHAFDNLSLIETLDIQWQTAESARQFATGELMISPITLRPRWNPYATSAPAATPIDELPPQVDPRQMSMFGAVWTLGSIVSLSRMNLLRSITYYETTGWRGLMETSAGPRLAHLFVSRPEMVFPMYFVFALIAGHRHTRRVSTTHRPELIALLCSEGSDSSSVRLLLASSIQRDIATRLPLEFKPSRKLTLNKSNAANVCRRPEDFLANGWEPTEDSIVKLGPFGLVAVDGQLV